MDLLLITVYLLPLEFIFPFEDENIDRFLLRRFWYEKYMLNIKEIFEAWRQGLSAYVTAEQICLKC